MRNISDISFPGTSRPILRADVRLPHSPIERVASQSVDAYRYSLLPVLQHDDLIGVLDGGQPMGDDEQRFPFVKAAIDCWIFSSFS
mgnify:CR=1 FL=1